MLQLIHCQAALAWTSRGRQTMERPDSILALFGFCLLLSVSRSLVDADCILGNQVGQVSLHNTGGQYIDLLHPVQCSGDLIAWHFCYYSEDIQDDDTYIVYFRVWRPADANNFNRVHEHTQEMDLDESDSNEFVCMDVPLDPDNYFEVVENDRLGAYVKRTNINGRPLHIISSGTTGLGLFRDTRGGGFDFTPFTSEVVATSDLEEMTDLGLHLYADIEEEQGPSSAAVSPTSTEVELGPSSATVAPTSTEVELGPSSAAVSPTSTEVELGPSSAAVSPTSTEVELGPSSATVSPTSTDKELGPSSATVAPTSTEEELGPSSSTVAPTSTEGPSSTRIVPTSTEAELGPSSSTVAPTSTDKELGSSSSTVAPTSTEEQLGPSSATVALTSMEQGLGPSSATVALTSMEGFPGLKQPAITTSPSPTLVLSQSDSEEQQSLGENIGAIAGIVFAALSVVTLVPFTAGLIVYRKWRTRTYVLPGRKKNHPTGIDNAIYGLDEGIPMTSMSMLLSQSGSRPTSYTGAGSELYERSVEYDTLYMNPNTAEEYYSCIGPSTDYYQFLEQAKEGEVDCNEDPYYSPATREDELYEQLRSQGIKSIPRAEVETVAHLGSGQFGNVDKGLWKHSGHIVEVAVKTCSAESSEEDKVKFLQEAAIMAQFAHPSVVKLYGVVSRGGPIMLVVELLPKGDLRQFVIALRPDPGELVPPRTPMQLLGFSQQISLGMQYLAGKGFVHRDLAARNILVSENNICKVGDFGMSRDLADENYYISHGGKVPLKWTAPEAILYHKYSTASDVWSYGCLLYEIWSLGHKPFQGYKNQEVLEKIDAGYRLPPPSGCPRVIYEIMIQSWNPDSASRPSFRDILLALLENQEAVLAIPGDALATHAQAGVLGAPMEAGQDMYSDLQQAYRTATTGL